MSIEEKDLLLSLLKKANEDGDISVYDENENYYEASWIFADGDGIILKIKEF